MNPKQVAKGLQRLKTILNEEVAATENHRQEVIKSVYNDVISGITYFSGKKEKATPKKIRKILEEKIWLVYIKSNHPSIIGRGKHQLVIDIGNNLVAKTPYQKRSDGVFVIGRAPYPFIKETKNVLSEINIETPEMNFYRFYLKGLNLKIFTKVKHFWHSSKRDRYLDRGVFWEFLKNCPNFCVTPDLRENGRYNVVDYSEENVKRLINKNFIISQFKDLSKRLEKMVLDENYKPSQKIILEYESHYMDSVEEAISKMFLLQVPKNLSEKGKLIVGDLDHIYAYHGMGWKFK